MAPEMAICLYWAALFVLNVVVIAIVLYWVIRKAVKRAILDVKKELAERSGSSQTSS